MEIDGEIGKNVKVLTYNQCYVMAKLGDLYGKISNVKSLLCPQMLSEKVSDPPRSGVINCSYWETWPQFFQVLLKITSNFPVVSIGFLNIKRHTEQRIVPLNMKSGGQ